MVGVLYKILDVGYVEWLYWEDGFLMWLRNMYMLFRVYLNINMFVVCTLVCSTLSSIAYIYAEDIWVAM